MISFLHFQSILDCFFRTILDYGNNNFCVPTVSYIPSFGFFWEIFLNATIAVTQLSITVLPLLPPAAPPSHRQEFDPVRILCWNYVERLSYAQVGSKKHAGLGLSSPSSLAHEESLSVVGVDEAKNTKESREECR